ncbi:MAG TPA: hypothetical protein PKH19_00830 [Candidatus Syntrophosphaera sp.]|nr:hypothetical protein [Candidatus Syntrophosphaera sp.]
MNSTRFLLLAALALLLASCVGGRLLLSADNTRYPVSLSPALHSPGGKLLSEADYYSVGTFKRDYERWSVFWSFIPLSRLERDISADLNAAISAAGGEAAVNLQVNVGNNNLNRLLSFTLLALMPITPSVHRVSVTADIVRLRD